ncbi:uncharacterized protein LOC107305202 isoform X2 [Oryza brachyantha]|uniref:uncharacterized protein LOC107305202 isoform X2 n=1 Tax=Oryza brachyantha TaxID=4533 RepID=UPI0007765395|nr:uncharacterized protein LOC107305202 isoform X2 [Oryza brachyantha]
MVTFTAHPLYSHIPTFVNHTCWSPCHHLPEGKGALYAKNKSRMQNAKQADLIQGRLQEGDKVGRIWFCICRHHSSLMQLYLGDLGFLRGDTNGDSELLKDSSSTTSVLECKGFCE